MIPSEASTAASRLCSQCGLCCNGVMFHTVRMQPADSPKALASLGLKLKRKRGANYILQPCPAFCGSHCAIYESRPERCRIFECRQLKRVAAGVITEPAARENIRQVQLKVAELDDLLKTAGAGATKRPLAKRFEKATAEPLDESSDIAAIEFRSRLTAAMRELDAILDREFRIVPAAKQ